MEDYSKYLSIDNGHGILIKNYDAHVLKSYGIDYMKYNNIKDLIYVIGKYLDDDYDEELDMVLSNLCESHYYNDVNK